LWHLAARISLTRTAKAVGLCCILAAGLAPACAQQQFVTTKGGLKRETWWLAIEI
jgi:hypothetical protein